MPDFCIDAAGWCDAARRYPSPYCDERAPGSAIELLVIHNISLPCGQYGTAHVADLFTGRLDFHADPSFAGLRGLEVSAHFFIRRDGVLMQFVATVQRAWHAGASSFNGRAGCNAFSIGVELEGCDADPFTPAQYAALAALTAALRRRHPLTDVRGHEHIAPGRKTDPGPHFDWDAYAAGLAASEAVSAGVAAPSAAALVSANPPLRFPPRV